MLVLGIESTCDETAVAVVREGKEILCNLIASQEIHRQYGGVYPELACRRHFDTLLPLLDQALHQAHLESSQIALIAVASGPGLIGALLLGLNAAKSLSLAWKKPFVGVNHVEAHLYGALMGCNSPQFPALGVVVSGGHTFLTLIRGLGHYEMIGQTVDDAIGEAFDKVAVLLGLPYPGGPEIEKLARQGDPSKYPFKAGVVKGHPWDFSFSGLKTNVLYTVKGQNCDKSAPNQIPDHDRPHIAAAFQEAALQDVVKKATHAAEKFGCRMMFLGGGVTQNQRLRDLLATSNIPVYFPPAGLSLDNAAMIAGLGYHLFLQNGRQGDGLDLDPTPRMALRKLTNLPV
jgi:N6-L-threonylcarbamoyladenine synthase